MTTIRRCRDCPPAEPLTSKRRVPRPAPHPGPRCATHHRAVVKARKAAARDKRLQSAYGLNQAEYDRLLAHQGGACAICQRVRGTTKPLCVDHDHETGEVRGLLCTYCNRMVGHVRDDPAAFDRGGQYLRNPSYATYRIQNGAGHTEVGNDG